MSDDIYSVYILKINFTLPFSYASVSFSLENRSLSEVKETSVGVIVNIIIICTCSLSLECLQGRNYFRSSQIQEVSRMSSQSYTVNESFNIRFTFTQYYKTKKLSRVSFILTYTMKWKISLFVICKKVSIEFRDISKYLEKIAISILYLTKTITIFS